MEFPAPGQVFEGKYSIEKILGSGGFARVYLAIEAGLQRPVALKILRPPYIDETSDTQREQWLASTMSRFEREAVILSQLRCPHTVIVYAFGRTQDGLMYMALEYVDGRNLTQLTRDEGALSATRTVKVLRQLLLSLKEAHALGMLHRDIKPANIMVFDHMGEKDNVKLLDFGIAKAVSTGTSAAADLTNDNTLIGTPRYMSPEQIHGESEVGPASDIYSLGLVVYELIVGERAIRIDNSLQVIGQQLAQGSFYLPETTDVPANLRNIVNRMLEKDLQRRYQSVDQILEDLSKPDVLSLRPLEEIPEIHVTLMPIEQESSPPSRKMLWVGVVVLVGVLIALTINIYAGKTDSLPAPTQSQTVALERPDARSDTVVEETVELLRLNVDANVKGAKIRVNGQEVGQTPSQIEVATLPVTVEAIFKEQIKTTEVKEPDQVVHFEFNTAPLNKNKVKVPRKDKTPKPSKMESNFPIIE